MPNVSGSSRSAVALCASADLVETGLAVGFNVWYLGQKCRAFAVRYQGSVHAYLNRCSHVPMEMDYQPNHFFDSSGQWLMCATHGAIYSPLSGRCTGGPCRGGLVRVALSEDSGVVHWHTSLQFKPVEPPHD